MSPEPQVSSRTVATTVTIVLSILVVVMAAGLAYSIVGTATVVSKIQNERVRNTRDSCLATNDRNERTKARFDERIPPPPAAIRDFTYGLIDALSPHRDCAEVVRRQTGESAP